VSESRTADSPASQELKTFFHSLFADVPDGYFQMVNEKYKIWSLLDGKILDKS